MSPEEVEDIARRVCREEIKKRRDADTSQVRMREYRKRGGGRGGESRSYTAPCPRNEAEVQALAWIHLVDLFGENQVCLEARIEGVRPDILVVNEDRDPWIIVEIKDKDTESAWKQAASYGERLELAYLAIATRKDIDTYICDEQTLMDSIRYPRGME